MLQRHNTMTKGVHNTLHGSGLREGKNGRATDARRGEKRRGRMVMELHEIFVLQL